MPDPNTTGLENRQSSLRQQDFGHEKTVRSSENKENFSVYEKMIEAHSKTYKRLLLVYLATTFVSLIAIVALVVFVAFRVSTSVQSETLRTAMVVFGGIGALLAGVSVTNSFYERQRKSRIETLRGVEKEFFKEIRQNLSSRFVGKVR